MTRCAACLALLCCTLTANAADRVQFERITGETTGISAAMQEWYRVEMERQGGPGKSHGWWPWGLRTADFDGDGVLDLLASHHGTPHSMLLRGERGPDGGLRFADATKQFGIDHRDLPGADDRPWVWDFDGDGFLDIAGLSDESSPGSAWNEGGKRFVPTKAPLFKSLAHPREVADLNGDGFLDLDAGEKGRWFFVPESKTFRHDPTPRFGTPAGLGEDVLAPFLELQKTVRFFRVDMLTHDVVGYDTLGYHPHPIDLDGDGTGDVVVRGSGGYGAPYVGRYLVRQKDGKLADRTAELGLPEAGAPIFIRDLTGDGLPEILIVGNKAGDPAGGLYVHDGKAYRRIDGAISKFLTNRGPYLIRAYQTDFDNDGQPDLILSNPRLGMTAVYHNQGGGQFAETLAVKGCWDSNPIAIADFDRDGRTDLAIGVRPDKTPGDVHLFLNRTEKAGRYVSILPRMATPNPYAVGAVVEVFAPGEAAKKDARPLLVEKSHPDGTPVHAGLGKHDACDVRVTFPGGKVVVREKTPADQEMTIKP